MKNIKIKLYNQKTEEIGDEKLSPKVFGVDIKPELIHQVMVAQAHNSRQVLAHTKGRSEVRGGGKKPWKQKGTGRARAGSSRSPIWIGGGVTFGPTKERNFSVKVNKKMKKKALLMCLSDKAKDDNIVLFDELKLDKVKTKDAANVLDKVNKKIISKLKGEKDSKTSSRKKPSLLLILGDDYSNIQKSVNNIERVGVIGVNSLNVSDILKYKYLLTTKDAVKKLEKIYAK